MYLEMMKPNTALSNVLDNDTNACFVTTTTTTSIKTGITTTIKLTSNMQRCNLQATYNKPYHIYQKNLQVARNGVQSGPGWVRRCLGDS